jgi:transcriptional regulator with XRE-family HTH domain
MNFSDRFGTNLREARKARGMTQEELAGQIRLHPTQLSKIERGKSAPGAETVVKLMGVLGTNGEVLYEGIAWDSERGVFVVTPASPRGRRRR